MTDDTVTSVDIPEDLGDFKASFFGASEPPEVEDTGDDTPATDEDEDAEAQTSDEDTAEEDTQEQDEDNEESEEESDEDEDKDEEESKPSPEDKGKRRKPSAQQRINELTRWGREQERQNALLMQRLEALEKSTRQPDTQEQTVKEQLPQGAPQPDAVDKDGNAIYPLGQFDEQFILDLTKYTIEQETAKLRTKEAEQSAAQQLANAQAELKAQWADKVEKAEEAVPEIREHIADLVEVFQDVDPAYGEYLATTIMQLDNGPVIMEYLSQNIGEAQSIVASGPHAATLALGRLEAKLSSSARQDADEKRNKKPSGAPPPPKNRTRGSSGQPSVRPDTTDLAAFKRDFFAKK